VQGPDSCKRSKEPVKFGKRFASLQYCKADDRSRGRRRAWWPLVGEAAHGCRMVNVSAAFRLCKL